tara:strand:- start:284 stop:802 length:519 start_codon:yes stop_codon:yes gene_type:complete
MLAIDDFINTDVIRRMADSLLMLLPSRAPISTTEWILTLVIIFIASAVIFTFSKRPRLVAMHKINFTSIPLLQKEKLSHDTNKYTFGLSTRNHVLGLPVGQHISLMFKDGEGKEVIRSYTPVNGDENYNDEQKAGTFSFVIKTYRPNERFPEGGKMSQYLDTLSPGDRVLMR